MKYGPKISWISGQPSHRRGLHLFLLGEVLGHERLLLLDPVLLAGDGGVVVAAGQKLFERFRKTRFQCCAS